MRPEERGPDRREERTLSERERAQRSRTLTERTWTRGEPVDAMQTALAAEHAAIWGYGVVGARVAADLRGQVREADSAHRARRDATAATVRTLGGDPAPTHASYQLPFRVTDQPSALRLAVHLEQGVAAAWRYVVASTDDRALRRTAVTALTDAAVRAARWRRMVTPATPTVPFPGG